MSDRHHATHALGRFGDRRAVRVLIGVLEAKRRGPRVRAMAAEALGEIADPRAEAALLGALSDASPEVQFFAAFALSAAGTRRSMPALAALAATRGTKTRFGTTAREARRALATIERRKTS